MNSLHFCTNYYHYAHDIINKLINMSLKYYSYASYHIQLIQRQLHV